MRFLAFIKRSWLEVVSLVVATVVFLVPFAFIVVTAVKDRAEASRLDFTWPTSWHVVENLEAVLTARDNLIVTGSEIIRFFV